MDNHDELFAHLIKFWKGKPPPDKSQHKIIEKLAKLVLAYFTSKEIGKICKNPTAYESEIKRNLEDLLLGDPAAMSLAGKLESGISRPESVLNIEGNHNQVFQVGRDITIKGSIPEGRPVWKLLFGGKKKDVIETVILFLAANPSVSGLDLDKEAKRIKMSLKLGRQRDKIEFKQETAVTSKDLIEAMQYERPTIVLCCKPDCMIFLAPVS